MFFCSVAAVPKEYSLSLSLSTGARGAIFDDPHALVCLPFFFCVFFLQARDKLAGAIGQTSLMQCCCVPQGTLMGHANALFVGDSLMRYFFEALCQRNASARPHHLEIHGCPIRCSQATLTIVQIGGSKAMDRVDFPSYHSAATVLPLLNNPGSAAPTLVVLNFGVLHLLHLHPVRPWHVLRFPHARCEAAQFASADWIGQRTLEQWIGADVAAYRLALPSCTQLVIMTPYIVCEEKYKGAWAEWLRTPRLQTCGDWVSGIHNVSGAHALPLDRNVQQTCMNSTLTAAGAYDMAERFRAAAVLHNTLLLDAAQLSLNHGERRCNKTKDGRHFPGLQNETVVKFKAILNGTATSCVSSQVAARLHGPRGQAPCLVDEYGHQLAPVHPRIIVGNADVSDSAQ